VEILSTVFFGAITYRVPATVPPGHNKFYPWK